MDTIPVVISPLDSFHWVEVIENALGNLIFYFAVLILLFAYGQSRSKLLPFLYKRFGIKVARFFRILIFFLTSVNLRLGFIFFMLFIINFTIDRTNKALLSLFVFLLSLSILWKPKRKLFFDPASIFSDGFDNKLDDSWDVKTGAPFIDTTFGKPSPDLELKRFSQQATNSFVVLKNHDIREGIIECDFNLEKGAIFNIVFLADISNNNWYMARFESRSGYSDGLLIKDSGPGNNWREFIMSGTNTEARKWFRARVEFSSKTIRMFKDNELIVQFYNPQMIFGGKVGLFNECNDVHVDNFTIYKPIASNE